MSDKKLTDSLDEVDVLRFENGLYSWGLTFNDLQNIKASMEIAGLVLAKEVRE